jgi:hypothetical protein
MFDNRMFVLKNYETIPINSSVIKLSNFLRSIDLEDFSMNIDYSVLAFPEKFNSGILEKLNEFCDNYEKDPFEKEGIIEGIPKWCVKIINMNNYDLMNLMTFSCYLDIEILLFVLTYKIAHDIRNISEEEINSLEIKNRTDQEKISFIKSHNARDM